MKFIAVPLTCLVIGGAVGYGLRSMQVARGRSQIETSQAGSPWPKAARTLAVNATTETGGSPSRTGNAPAAPQRSLADRMRDLLADYDEKSAQKALAELSATDIQAALAIVSGMPKGGDRDPLRAQLYRAWARLDPSAAWKAALADSPDKDRAACLAAVAGEVAKTNPKAAIDLAMSLGMGGKRSTVMSRILEDWSKVDVGAAIAYANAHPDQVPNLVTFARGLSRLAETQPAQAADLAVSLKDSLARNGSLSVVMTAWVERDPAAAMKWAEALSNPSLRKDAIASAISAWVKIDPAAAIARAQSLPGADSRAEALKKGLTEWFRSDPTAAITYATLPENQALLPQLGFMLGYLSEGFSGKERAGLLARIPEGQAKEDIVRSVTDWQIRKGQYNQALELLNAMPDSSSRDGSVAKLGEAWAAADPAAATAWLKIQPESSDRDLAVAGFTRELARTDPAAALEWTRTIPDQKLRVGAMKNVAVRWMKNDAANAEAWMGGVAEFSEFDRKMIRDMASRNFDLIGMPLSVGQRH